MYNGQCTINNEQLLVKKLVFSLTTLDFFLIFADDKWCP